MWGFNVTSIPCNIYVHVTGYPVQHGVSYTFYRGSICSVQKGRCFFRNAVNHFSCSSLLKVSFFSNKCAYPKVRETIAWYLLCFWSTGTTLEWTQCNSMLPKIQSGCFANILLMFCWSASKLLRLQEVNRLRTYIYLSVSLFE